MRRPPFRFFAAVFICEPVPAGDVVIQNLRLPDRVVNEVVAFIPVDSGFYPAHAPARYLHSNPPGQPFPQRKFVRVRRK